jgi:hypothetical protein
MLAPGRTNPPGPELTRTALSPTRARPHRRKTGHCCFDSRRFDRRGGRHFQAPAPVPLLNRSERLKFSPDERRLGRKQPPRHYGGPRDRNLSRDHLRRQARSLGRTYRPTTAKSVLGPKGLGWFVTTVVRIEGPKPDRAAFGVRPSPTQSRIRGRAGSTARVRPR